MLSFLRSEGVSEDIVSAIEAFRSEHKVSPEAQHRLTEKPRFEYYGKEVWEAAATALLCGENLLLVGPKATGKNVLAECLAAAFGRPSWDISFYINTDGGGSNAQNSFMSLMSGEKGEFFAKHPLVSEALEECSQSCDITGLNYLSGRYELEHELHGPMPASQVLIV